MAEIRIGFLGPESCEIKGRLKQDCVGFPTQSFLAQSPEETIFSRERQTTFRAGRDDSLQAFAAR
jgi:hypothetical protein